MEWIASMPGPLFLAFYALVTTVTLLGCWLAVRTAPETEPAPLVPANPDPYEIAYLRGGEPEVGRLAIIDLARRGLLHESAGKGLLGKTRLRPAADQNADRHLPSAPSRVLSLFRSHDEPVEKMQKLPAFREAVRAIAEPFAMRYAEPFLVSPSRRMAVRALGWAVILGLGGYKLVVALQRGHTNVLFLIMMALVALPILSASTKSRLNGRGKVFLKKIQSAYSELKTKPKIAGAPLAHSDLLLAVGLFGAPVLLGGADVHYAEMLGRQAMRDSGVTGGSCSSCSSSSSGDGGGCGGGCGGCGGD